MYTIELQTLTARQTETSRIESPVAESGVVKGEPVLADNGLVKH